MQLRVNDEGIEPSPQSPKSTEKNHEISAEGGSKIMTQYKTPKTTFLETRFFRTENLIFSETGTNLLNSIDFSQKLEQS